MSAERWVPVPSDPAYEVSSLGRVRHGDRIMKQSLHRAVRGYRACSIKGRARHVHVLVAAAFIGPRPAGMQIRHLDGDRENNRAENLAYGTPAENARDRLSHGTNGRKLTEDEVRTIRQRRDAGETLSRIASSYGVTHQLISAITRGDRWAAVTP